MVSVTALWLPILLSAVFVFVVSSILHMVFTYHNSDLKGLPDEEGVREALGKFNIPPGNYFVPYAANSKERNSAEFKEKMVKGPVAIITSVAKGTPAMGKELFLWFVYLIIVGIFTAYITGLALGPGTHYMMVFRVAGATAFCGHSLALMHHAIWFKWNWGATLKSMFDGLIYALVTAGTFGWLWPALM